MAGGELDSGAVLGNVRELCDAPAASLVDVERVLTDGYACVLRTEDERRRLRGRLEERVVTVSAGGSAGVVEIKALAQGIARADSQIEELRAALRTLAAKASRLRVRA
ncbi:MAG: hypothetical protein ACM3QU_02670 [Verrucomicrobiota bacterium]